MASLTPILAGIANPRTGNAQRQGLLNIMVIALAALVCGEESCVEFAEDREAVLRDYLLV